MSVDREPTAVVESTSHKRLLTRPSFSGQANGRSAPWTKFQAQPTSTFIRSVLKHFRRGGRVLDILCGEEHLYADGSSTSALAKGAMADNRLKRQPARPVPNVSAKAPAVVKFRHLRLPGLEQHLTRLCGIQKNNTPADE